MTLQDFMLVLRKHWVSILLFTLVGVGGAAAVNYYTPRSYTATAQDFVAIATVDPTVGNVLSGSQFVLQRVQSYTQVVESPQVLQPVIDELGLQTDWQALAARVSATNPTDTVLINVSVVDPNPAQAAAIANATAEQLGVVVQQLETPVDGGTTPVKVSVVTPAEPPASPSAPRTRVNLILGLLIGLAVGVGQALLREALDTSVKSPDDLVALTGSTPLGIIGYDPEAKAKPLVALNPQSRRAESFRTIRTNLQYVDADHRPTVIALTSSLPLEGKSTTVVNLAIVMAQAGQRVVVVETDLRRPKATEYLGIEPAIGLTDVLTGHLPLDEALVSWNRGLLTVLPAGRVPPNPSELLASQTMIDTIAVLRSRFDVVLIDTTPLLPVTDGSIVARISDGAIVVVHHGTTKREAVDRALLALEQVDAHLLGTVLNFVPVDKSGYGYSYGYGHRHGYGHYQTDPAQPRHPGPAQQPDAVQ